MDKLLMQFYKRKIDLLEDENASLTHDIKSVFHGSYVAADTVRIYWAPTGLEKENPVYKSWSAAKEKRNQEILDLTKKIKITETACACDDIVQSIHDTLGGVTYLVKEQDVWFKHGRKGPVAIMYMDESYKILSYTAGRFQNDEFKCIRNSDGRSVTFNVVKSYDIGAAFERFKNNMKVPREGNVGGHAHPHGPIMEDHEKPTVTFNVKETFNSFDPNGASVNRSSPNVGNYVPQMGNVNVTIPPFQTDEIEPAGHEPIGINHSIGFKYPGKHVALIEYTEDDDLKFGGGRIFMDDGIYKIGAFNDTKKIHETECIYSPDKSLVGQRFDFVRRENFDPMARVNEILKSCNQTIRYRPTYNPIERVVHLTDGIPKLINVGGAWYEVNNNVMPNPEGDIIATCVFKDKKHKHARIGETKIFNWSGFGKK